MSTTAELVVLAVMLIGLVGTVVPVLPGLLLIWAAGVAWAWLDGWGPARGVTAAVLTVLLVVGTVVKYVLPARSARGAGAPRRTLLLGAVGAVVGFVAIPVVGLVVGAVVAVYLAELSRLGDSTSAWASTRAVVIGIGVGVLVEVATGLLMVAVWVVSVLAV